jgi:hypothetical protein
MGRQKILNCMVEAFSLLLISSWFQFWSVNVAPKYLNFATYSKDLLAALI